MQPAELSKMQSINGGAIKTDDVYYQVLLLLKNIIKDYWEGEAQSLTQDKENVNANAKAPDATKYVISNESKDLVKNNIFQLLDNASSKRNS